MGQQQLLLLVLGIVIVGLVGICGNLLLRGRTPTRSDVVLLATADVIAGFEKAKVNRLRPLEISFCWGANARNAEAADRATRSRPTAPPAAITYSRPGGTSKVS